MADETTDEPAGPEVAAPDPVDFLRALMRISAEDAVKARAGSPPTRKRKPPEGPRHDFGEN